MEKKITKAESILLFLNASSYKLASDIRSDGYTHRYAYIPVLTIECALANFVATDWLHLNSIVPLTATIACFLLQLIVLSLVKKKVELIADNYYNYYNGYLYSIFILLTILGYAYFFNSLIGGQLPAKAHH